MKAKNKEGKDIKFSKTFNNGHPNYYFHADDDFKIDWNWAKEKTIKSPPRRKKQFS